MRRTFARLLLWAALSLLGFGAVMIALEAQFLWRAQRAFGEVTALHEQSWTEFAPGRYGPSHVERKRIDATVGFCTADGRQIRMRTALTHEGHVAVVYSPSHPERAQLDDPISKWGLQAGVVLAGLALLGGWRRFR